MARSTTTLTLLCVALLGLAAVISGAHGASLRGGRQLDSTAVPHGYWNCFTTNGIVDETLTYGFSSTTGGSSTSTLKMTASMSVKQGFSYGLGDAVGSTSVKISGSIAHTQSTSVSYSTTTSSTTTVTTKCPPSLCPETGAPKDVNVCQWTLVSDTFKLASKTILFAPTGQKPNCPYDDNNPGQFCDFTHDSWCSRCNESVCEQYPKLPGCSWFKPTAYMFNNQNFVRAENIAVQMYNPESSRMATNGLVDKTNGDWMAYSVEKGRWESGDTQHVYSYINGPGGAYPPEGPWQSNPFPTGYAVGGRTFVQSATNKNPFVFYPGAVKHTAITGLVNPAIPGEWIAYVGDNMWQRGNVGSADAFTYIVGPAGDFPPSGTWKSIATSKSVSYNYVVVNTKGSGKGAFVFADSTHDSTLVSTA